MTTFLLLLLSNVFMNIAWYGHLKYKDSPLWLAIAAGWGLAFFEYCLQVPANRWGNARFTATQLKVLQEALSVGVFIGVAVFYLKERLRWNHWAAFILVFAAVALANLPDGSARHGAEPAEPAAGG